MAYNETDQDDLDRWLASQQAPTLDPTPQPAAAGGEHSGMWERAAKMLGAQSRNSAPDPSPQPSTLDSWGTILGMLASKDPGGVLAQDAAGRRAAVDAWQRRQAARDDSAFGRQMAAAGLLQRQDDAARAQAAQVFDQDRATAADISQAANTDWAHGHTEARDQVSDQQFGQTTQLQRDRMAQDALQARQQLGLGYSRLKQDQGQFDASQSGLDARQLRQLQAQQAMNDADNTASLAAVQARAAGKVAQPLPGTHVTDPDAYNQFMQSPANVKDLTEHLGTAQQVRGYVGQLRELLGKKRSAANEAAYNTIIKQLIGDRSKEGSTGVLSNTEFARYIEDLPEYGITGGLKSWRGALETVRGKDPRVGTLDALDQALRKGQGSKFGAYGIALDDGGNVPGPASPPAAAAVDPEDDPLLKRYGRLKAAP